MARGYSGDNCFEPEDSVLHMRYISIPQPSSLPLLRPLALKSPVRIFEVGDVPQTASYLYPPEVLFGEFSGYLSFVVRSKTDLLPNAR